MPTASTHSPNLTLLEGEAQVSPEGLAPLPPIAGEWATQEPKRTLLRRPGDNLELVVFKTAGTVRAVRHAARDRGLNADTAVSLVCERRLALADLAELGLAELEPAIDEAAAAAQRKLGVWGPESAYLRHLRDGDSTAAASPAASSTPRAAVPIRLIGRLGKEEVLAIPLRNGELAEAVQWEVASLLSGRLLAEWTAHTALTALAASAASN